MRALVLPDGLPDVKQLAIAGFWDKAWFIRLGDKAWFIRPGPQDRIWPPQQLLTSPFHLVSTAVYITSLCTPARGTSPLLRFSS
jgi:hypothetical protein